MGNILGQPFSPWVTKQINIRQQSLGYVNYDNTDLLYQNSKTPWIRLASSVDIEQAKDGDGNFTNDGVLDKMKKIGVPRNAVQGPIAARNFILQGGAIGMDSKGNVVTYQGLNTTVPPVTQFYQGAYGWGETTERGFVPLPGILDADLIYYNNGALSKATINMKCFSRNQLALMDALYMRPGYNLLLEFGWTAWLDNYSSEKTLRQNDSFASPALSFMLGDNAQGTDDNPSNFEIPRLIQSYRRTCSGNYEGVFGKVTNFKWKFNPDGSYDCQTQITGMGGIIESLKINGATFTKNQKAALKQSEATIKGLEGSVLDAAGKEIEKTLNATKLKTELDNKIDTIYQNFKSTTGKYVANDESDRYNKVNYSYTTYSIPNFPDPADKFKKKTLYIDRGIYAVYGVSTDTEQNLTPVCYMSFGMFIAILQNEFLVYGDDGRPFFSFAMDFFNLEKDDNYILNLPGQFSANPLVCFTPYNNVPVVKTKEGINLTDKVNIPETSMNTVFQKAKPHFIVGAGESEYLGRLAHVYLNFEFIKKCLADAPRDAYDNSLALLPFLKTILAGVCKARGGINNILVHEDINTNTIKFIEEVPQNWANAIPPRSDTNTFCKINTFGVKDKVEGSIVRSLDLGGSISKDFANMISIGAQSNGNQLNENATAFSKYNRGLIDRTFREKKTNKEDVEKSTFAKDDPAEKDTLSTIWNEKIYDSNAKRKSRLFWTVMAYVSWIEEDIKALESANISFIKILQGILVQEDVIQSPFFLPFNLSLDIDGISGIKLYQKFQIDDNVLPPSYDKDSVDLQIKGANHTVNSEDWITKIETQSVPRSGEVKTAKLKPLKPKEVEAVVSNPSTLPVVPDEQVTITSQYPLEDIFYPENTPKTQIYLHHTAGNQNVKRTIEIWNNRTDHVSTHYITNNNGETEQLYVDEYWANHLGVKGATFRSLGLQYRNLNKYSLGIELSAFGGVTLKGGQYKTIYNSTLPESGVAQPINKFGKPMTYKGYAYYEKYSNAQIANVKNVVQGWMDKYSIPFNYDWDELFDPKTLSKKALKGEKGVYTHNSVRTGKQDIFPQKELLDMLKSIATNVNEPPAANTIVWEVLQSNVDDLSTELKVFVDVRGTLNGESFSYDSVAYYPKPEYNRQAAIDEEILFCKGEVIYDGDNEGNNDWVNAENTVPISD